jgi:SAM-dependent methyltransferase
MFQLTLFLSAFLLFLVQPLVAKQLLPWYGGSAAVWTTCLLFFQSVLLAGYGYAHWLTRRVPPQRQSRLHASLIFATLLALLLTPRWVAAPQLATQPILGILSQLALQVGLPYFALACTGPLLQAWHARQFPDRATYRLYALSNIGSFLGLLCFPLALEPALARHTIWMMWCGLYGLYAVAMLLIARRGARLASGAALLPAVEIAPERHPGIRAWYWVFLATAGSVLLISGTAHLTQDVAAIPFLWVLPLAVYLLAFVLAFDRERWYRPALFIPLALAATLLLSVALTDSIDQDLLASLKSLRLHPINNEFWSTSDLMPAAQAIPLFTVGLFVLCWFCNGELVRTKPGKQRLTWFYLLIAAGGALGGLIVSVLGPALLDGFYELPAALLAVAVLCVIRARGWWRLAAAVPALTVAVFGLRYATDLHTQTLLIQRDFYGLLRVEQVTTEDGRPVRRFLSGVILHGAQDLSWPGRRVPTEYYTTDSGIGRTLQLLSSTPQHVGLIGLGAGTLAAYGREGDRYQFFEINPDVERIARTNFSFLSDSPAQISVTLGDARLSLSRLPPQHFDVLVVDAFSSDAIPVHLLTREAMREYARHVAPDGVIAFDLTNRELTLEPIVQDLANAIGRSAVLISTEAEDQELRASSDWMLVTNNRTVLDALLESPARQVVSAEPWIRPWTDDYSSLLQVWKPLRELRGRPDY